MTRHSRKWKESQLQELKRLADTYPVIAIASLKNFPGALAKELRKKMKGKAVIKVCKTRVLKMAFKESKKDEKQLDEHIKGSIAVIFTEMNPFELYAFLKKNKVSMPAKAGMAATDDVVVPAGDTGLPPGPALSDLKAVGLKTVMQGPTISIAEDKVVTKKGETVSAQVASALAKLGIKPAKVGLNVVAVLEKGQVYLANVLDIDTGKVRQMFADAARNAFSLAVDAGYFTKATAGALIAKGYRSAKAVAIEASILNSATVAELLARASCQATALKAKAPGNPPEEPKEEAKETVAEGKDAKEVRPKEDAKEAAAKEKAEEKKEEEKNDAKKEDSGKKG